MPDNDKDGSGDRRSARLSRADCRGARNQRLREADEDGNEKLRHRLNIRNRCIDRHDGKLADRTLFGIVMMVAGGAMRLVQHRYHQHADDEYQSQESGDTLFHGHGNPKNIAKVRLCLVGVNRR